MNSSQRVVPGRGIPSRATRCFLLVLLATIVVFLPTIDGYYLSDDYRFFIDPGVIDWGTLLRTHDQYMRPLPALSMIVEYRWWGSWTLPAHVTNLAFHLLNTALVASMARRLGGTPPVACLAALLFGLHPVHTEVGCWLSARFDLFSTAGILGGLVAFDAYLARRHMAPLALSALLFACAVLSKESALAFPLLAFAYAWVRSRIHGESSSPRGVPWLAFLALGAVVLAYVLLRLRIFGTFVEEERLVSPLFDLTDDLFLRPLRWTIVPIDTSLWSGASLPLGVLHVLVLTVALSLGALAALRARALQSPGLLLFGVCLYCLSLLPVLPNLYRLVHTPPPLRLLYLPSAGYCLALAVVAGQVSAPVLRRLSLAIGLLFAVTTLGNSLAWRRAAQLTEEIPARILADCTGVDSPLVIVQDAPRAYHGAYLFVKDQLRPAVRHMARKDHGIHTVRDQGSSKGLDLRGVRPIRLVVYQWLSSEERLEDITQPVRQLLLDYHTPRPRASWIGEELAQWEFHSANAVEQDARLVLSPSTRLTRVVTPPAPVNTGVLELELSVVLLEEGGPPPRCHAVWHGRSRKTIMRPQVRRLETGESTLRIRAPTVARMEDLVETDLRAILNITPSRCEVTIVSARVLPYDPRL